MPSLIPNNAVPPPTVATPLGYFPPPFESCLDTFAAAAAALNPRTADRTEVEKSLKLGTPPAASPTQLQVLEFKIYVKFLFVPPLNCNEIVRHALFNFTLTYVVKS